MNKLEESEPEPPTSQEDECVICINARATMQTSPCGHRVVCRRCFVKTIQSAVAQRLLPLRCVICRARINRLISGSGTWRIQESASNYSVGTSRSWAVCVDECTPITLFTPDFNYSWTVFFCRLQAQVKLLEFVWPNRPVFIRWAQGPRICRVRQLIFDFFGK